MKQMDPLISVVISFKNEAPTLPLILDTLANQKTDFPFEVLFADGCSTDNSVEVIKNHPLAAKVPVEILPLAPENHGMTVGWNTGSRKARGKILVFSQADIRVKDPHALTKIAKAYEDPAVVGTYYISLHSDAEFERYDFWGQVFQSHHLGTRILSVFDDKFNSARKDIFDKMNGFDDVRFALGGEAGDFLERLRTFGKVVDTEIEAENIHALGKKHSPWGLLKKHARNAEVMGANLKVMWKTPEFELCFYKNLAQRGVVCLNCIASLVPLTWPWTLLLSMAIGSYWNKASFKHIRNWRLIYVPFFGFAGVYYFTLFYLRGLVQGKTTYVFDNTMR